jgi:ribosomal protein L29
MMKKKELQSLRAMSDDELVKQVRSHETDMAKGKVLRAGKQMKNTREFRGKRLRIAVSRTILAERAR